jgi:hypothetical protein
MMYLNSPTINFNGAFLVNSMETGSLQIMSKQFFAVRILFQQTLNYPVLAYENSAAEIYAYCFDARQRGNLKLEAYAPCYLLQDKQSDNMTPVIANITWYVPSALYKRCADRAEAVLAGEVSGPVFQGKPFAVFSAE